MYNPASRIVDNSKFIYRHIMHSIASHVYANSFPMRLLLPERKGRKEKMKTPTHLAIHQSVYIIVRRFGHAK
jgi:hypothetical protein